MAAPPLLAPALPDAVHRVGEDKLEDAERELPQVVDHEERLQRLAQRARQVAALLRVLNGPLVALAGHAQGRLRAGRGPAVPVAGLGARVLRLRGGLLGQPGLHQDLADRRVLRGSGAQRERELRPPARPPLEERLHRPEAERVAGQAAHGLRPAPLQVEGAQGHPAGLEPEEHVENEQADQGREAEQLTDGLRLLAGGDDGDYLP
mmetsp:Transcript_31147/g.89288  ORF Transcript_31147/g.89288 Transcript_31147/m.89288 type:complete len:206 (+) Transcript_31147:556-1173(+)